MSEGRYSYSDDIESIVDMKDSTDGLGTELTTSDVVLRLNQLEADLAKAKIGFHPSCLAVDEENEALRLKAKHTVQSVNIIRGVMRINREHKDLFGGEVYLVDHTHMWALVRNAEDLDALLTGEKKEWVHPMTMGEIVDAEE